MLKKGIVLLIFLIIFPSFSFAADRFFEVQSVDTMKYSRDRARDPTATALVPLLVRQAVTLHLTHLAIGTPYNEEFYPIMKQWVQEARKNKLKVWFRGNLAEWEGWFDYPKLQKVEEHYGKVFAFITAHPDLFEQGDIFTPAPEPEQGLVGDPRKGVEIKKAYLRFLVDSYTNCEKAMQEIGVATTCGYFSMNGDIAKDILNTETVRRIGNVVVIDHYVREPEQLRTDIEYLHNKFGVKIVLGEYGAPIPDIHGIMNEAEQASYMKRTFTQLLMVRSVIQGVNYWTAFDGTTALFTPLFEPKLVAQEISSVYNPIEVRGVVQNIFHEPVKNAYVFTSPFLATKTDAMGTFHILTTPDYLRLNISNPAYHGKTRNLSQKNMGYKLLLTMEHKNKSIWYYLRLFLQRSIERATQYYRSILS